MIWKTSHPSRPAGGSPFGIGLRSSPLPPAIRSLVFAAKVGSGIPKERVSRVRLSSRSVRSLSEPPNAPN